MPRYQRKRPPGRPPHVPTTKLREAVANYAATGYNHDSIAACIGISVPTMYQYYRHELDFSEMEMLGKARKKLAVAVDAGSMPAIKYMLETKGKHLGWSQRVEHTGADGEPLYNLDNLSADELVKLRALVSKTTQSN